MRWKYVSILIVIALYAGSTYLRNAVWHEVPVLWADVVRKSPSKGRGYLNLCQYYSERRDFDIALFNCNAAITIDSRMDKYLIADAYINRGGVYADLRKYNSALADYFEALTLKPGNFRVYNNIGNIYTRQGRYDLADESYSRSISINPRYALAYVNRGYLKRKVSDPASAVQDFSISIRLNPDDDKAYAGRAAAFFSMGDQRRGIDDLRQCCIMGNSKCCDLMGGLGKTQ